ncbi:MAG TPA: dTDP-4-dehydrorhamnose 3,5-epimerase family protein [Polyangiaceae bacterium]|nr:dTDP-4-dehydrorhamnose 3,5-epimerase family protein [Polyangiaceae bacterium]
MVFIGVIFKQTALAGAYVIEIEARLDERGAFARTFCEHEFAAHGLPTRFPQSNLSRNLRAGTLRGMHYRAEPHTESKLVRPATGGIYDVIVDLREESGTRYQSFGIELLASEGSALFVPAGFAHGFITLQDDTDVLYQMGDFFKADAALGFRWNDPFFAIAWPREPTVIAERDAHYPDFVPSSANG